MNSHIKFTHSISTKSVDFLDVTVSLDSNGCLTTDLFNKPTAAHQYLLQSSYHPRHMISSIPKSQFLRIRRICSTVQSYQHHARRFISYFVERGYDRKKLEATVLEVANKDRQELLYPTAPQTSNSRIPLVLTYHHKFSTIPKIIHDNYKKMIEQFPDTKSVFPEPPLVAYRRAANLTDKLVRAKHWLKKNGHQVHIPRPSRAAISTQLNNTYSLRNAFFYLLPSKVCMKYFIYVNKLIAIF